jgi:hypothetical protein
MTQNTRMSPLTAFFLGLFGVGAVAIGCVTAVALRGLSMVDSKTSSLINLVDGTVDGLPELLASLPPALGDVLNDRRAPEYAANVDVQLDFLPADDGIRPVLTVSNKGTEVISMLAIRVAALSDRKLPLSDWTHVVATPVAIDDDWPGPLYPGNKRHLVLHRTRTVPATMADSLEGAVEIADVRVWVPKTEM